MSNENLSDAELLDAVDCLPPEGKEWSLSTWNDAQLRIVVANERYFPLDRSAPANKVAKKGGIREVLRLIVATMEAKKPKVETRELGFYWVQISPHSPWEIAELNTNGWYCIGEQDVRGSSELFAIGQKIPQLLSNVTERFQGDIRPGNAYIWQDKLVVVRSLWQLGSNPPQVTIQWQFGFSPIRIQTLTITADSFRAEARNLPDIE